VPQGRLRGGAESSAPCVSPPARGASPPSCQRVVCGLIHRADGAAAPRRPGGCWGCCARRSLRRRARGSLFPARNNRTPWSHREVPLALVCEPRAGCSEGGFAPLALATMPPAPPVRAPGCWLLPGLAGSRCERGAAGCWCRGWVQDSPLKPASSLGILDSVSWPSALPLFRCGFLLGKASGISFLAPERQRRREADASPAGQTEAGPRRSASHPALPADLGACRIPHPGAGCILPPRGAMHRHDGIAAARRRARHWLRLGAQAVSSQFRSSSQGLCSLSPIAGG